MVSCCIVAITTPYNSNKQKIQIKHVFKQQPLLQAFVLTGTVYRKHKKGKGRHPKILAKTGRRFWCAVVVVWTSLGPLPRWVPGPTTRWASGTTRLALHGTRRRGAQGLHRSSTRLGSCTCSALYGGLLDVLD
jgi:hypothetical protein